MLITEKNKKYGRSYKCKNNPASRVSYVKLLRIISILVIPSLVDVHAPAFITLLLTIGSRPVFDAALNS